MVRKPQAVRQYQSTLFGLAVHLGARQLLREWGRGCLLSADGRTLRTTEFSIVATAAIYKCIVNLDSRFFMATSQSQSLPVEGVNFLTSASVTSRAAPAAKADVGSIIR
jgi:hypothetical protein